MNYLPAGPTPILFALLAQYHAAIPYEYKYRIATSASPSTTNEGSNNNSSQRGSTTGLALTSKSLSYIPALQLALSQLPGSLLAAAIGWAVGYAYRHDVLPGASTWRVPGWVVGERRKQSEGFEGLRRRMMAEEEGSSGSASGREGRGEGTGRRRTLGGVLGSMVGGGS